MVCARRRGGGTPVVSGGIGDGAGGPPRGGPCGRRAPAPRTTRAGRTLLTALDAPAGAVRTTVDVAPRTVVREDKGGHDAPEPCSAPPSRGP